MPGPKVVVIGAGIVGCALADELTGQGWTDVTVLEQGPLFSTGGSSSHSAGLIVQTSPSRTLSRLARYTADKYAELGCFSPVGSLEVAATPERLAELHRRFGFGQSWGIGSAVLDPAACKELFPLLDPARILGGLHVPSDGVAAPVRAAEAQAARAASRGARFIGNERVVAVLRQGDQVSGVRSADAAYPADVVISCAGFWGPAVGELAGVAVPMLPMAHQFVRTTAVGASAGLPVLRHPDRGLYLRAYGEHLGVGAYLHEPLPVDLADVPEDNRPAMLPFTSGTFKQSWSAVAELIPSLSRTALEEAFNGVLAVTADGFPLLGESRELRGLWIAGAVSVTHSAGAAKALAEWLVDGYPGIDLHECDLNRFDPGRFAPAYVRRAATRAYTSTLGIVHPQDPPAVRNLRLSPFHPRQAELGAVFGEVDGWELPLWYATNPPPEEIRSRDDWSARHWSPIAETEARQTRKRVAVYDLTGQTRIEVTGPASFLTGLTSSDVSQDGVTRTLLLDPAGGIRGDVTVARLAEDRFLVIGGPLDLDLLRRRAPAGVTVRDVTGGTCGLGVWGPRAPDLLRSLRSGGYLGMVPVTVLPLSAVGEPGAEIYTEAQYGLRLWDTIGEAGREAGLVAAGRLAYESLRIENGRRAWGVDLTGEDDPYQAGLEALVRPGARPATLPDRRLASLRIEDTGEVPLGGEPVYAGGFVVGHVTSAAYGWTAGAPIALAWLPAALSVPGTQVEIGYFDRRLLATVAAEPLVEPMENKRG
ncbi:sarcosine dehydrogenase [Actinoplanes sp. OR16]|uniref:GcvT family protein n=1 Tax=Actinoplanes sp. OR16 TaxID=946334 RepID=UPI000F6CCFBC|nr:FAD-dependent oxidoreductase [Actinoplanes sp. OR16]BBH64021.1 sarcosine dehydrogenase [Actinoplanes sp. OR16]